jgi:hypothetical protein
MLSLMPSKFRLLAVSAACLICLTASRARADAPTVTVAQTPNAGLQPQVAVDDNNVVHLVYLKGDPSATDVFYVRSTDGGATWSVPVRVNSQAGSAIAMGTVRGAHLALGTHGLIHVAWTGSKRAEPKAPGDQAPMLYARGTVDASGKVTFEPQRNVMTSGLFREGGSVAADEKGHVYVAWHALAKKGGNEDDRRVCVAVSADDGKTFAPDSPISDPTVGVCGCCGLDVLTGADGRLYALYRGEISQVTRDVYLASTDASAMLPQTEKVAPTRSSICLMSTSSLARGPRGIVGAWETADKVQWAVIDPKTGRMFDPVTAARAGSKHPALAVDKKGETLVAWAQGTGWNKGGSVSWQVYDAGGTPMAGASGHVDGLPVWSKPAAFARPGGGFVVLY